MIVALISLLFYFLCNSQAFILLRENENHLFSFQKRALLAFPLELSYIYVLSLGKLVNTSRLR